ncbi:MAG TPA: histidine--tRNA ligase, partial [Acidimicrobiales bacterium]|nr:histidine--tRNA ligase [Acidimicrobiales bacterium]
MTAFQAPSGTKDVLAPESARVETLVGSFARACRLASYGLIISPMFEDVGVFRRGVGDESDVVRKEMYEFEDKGGRHLALRPEGTAPVVRAYLQHRPATPWKTWYVTPAFRYERPQAGRYRQFHQLGIEALGSDDPDLDVEVIALLSDFYRDVGLARFTLRLNSMGDGACRPQWIAALAGYLESHASQLCAEHKEVWSRNPIRVLDCKRPECLAHRPEMPTIGEYLCEECRAHFARVIDGLDALGVAFERDEYLVRGLDYYTRTTFEFASDALDTAQNAIGGGGRYDGLAGALGGPETPGIGFALGIERLLLAADAEGALDVDVAPEICVVDLIGGDAARDLAHELRRAGVTTDRTFDNRSMKSQLRHANASGARYALIVGAREAASGTVAIR